VSKFLVSFFDKGFYNSGKQGKPGITRPSLELIVKQSQRFIHRGIFLLLIASFSMQASSPALAQELTAEKQQEADALTQQIRATPNDYSLYAKRGFIYKKAGDNNTANIDFEKALSLNAGWQQGYVLRAYKFGAANQPKEVVEAMEAAEKIGPLTLHEHLLYGDALWAVKRYEMGTAEFDKVLKMDPTNVEAVANKALVQYDKVGATPAVIEQLKNAHSVNPKDTVVNRVLTELKILPGEESHK
jgi:tetratricopeptide (TPR) repeat protein